MTAPTPAAVAKECAAALQHLAAFHVEYESHGLPGPGESVLGREATADDIAAALLPILARHLARAEQAVATNARLNRRLQSAESGLAAAIKGHERDGPSFGRALANAAATMYREQAEQAVAMLREVEWSGDVEFCVVCDSHQRDGHAKSCRLAALLAGREAGA